MHTFSPANSDSVGTDTSHLLSEGKRAPSVGVMPIEVLLQIRFRLCHLQPRFSPKVHITPSGKHYTLFPVFMSRWCCEFENLKTPAGTVPAGFVERAYHPRPMDEPRSGCWRCASPFTATGKLPVVLLRPVPSSAHDRCSIPFLQNFARRPISNVRGSPTRHS